METEKSIFNNSKFSEKELCRRMIEIRSNIVRKGDKLLREGEDYDDAAFFLTSICGTMSNAPSIYSLEVISWIWIWDLDLDDEFAFVYNFSNMGHLEGEIVNIFLVRTRNNTVRLFSVEASSRYMLYEYANGCRFDYGEMEFKDITIKINTLLEMGANNPKYEPIKQIMYNAIEEKRPAIIEKYCRRIWNQPFFFKIDIARALTISYNPTDKGARSNYKELIDKYDKEGELSTETIFDTLYNFQIESHWRGNYNYLFGKLGVPVDKIAHMDISSFPYDSFEFFNKFRGIDNSYKYVLECLDLLLPQLRYIWLDGSKNRKTLSYIEKGFFKIGSYHIAINKGLAHELIIYKHEKYKTILFYYGCPIWGEGRVSKEGLENLAEFIVNILTRINLLNYTKADYEEQFANFTSAKIINKGEKENMKLCPKCQVNYIADNEELCTVCKDDLKISHESRQNRKSRLSVYFNEDFTFLNERATYKTKKGFKAYNSNGDFVGIVFMTDDKRVPSFGFCELGIYPEYQNRYGEWHRFTSNGCRLKWEDLCKYLATNVRYTCHID